MVGPMTTPRVKLYSKRWCGYCVAARRLLAKRGVAYEEIDVTGNSPLRQQIIAETGWRTVPVILIDGELIGGYTELARLHAQGGLDGLLPE